MRAGWLLVLTITLAVTACGSDDDADEDVDDQGFLEGREMVTIYERKPRTDDLVAEIELLGAAFGVDAPIRDRQDGSDRFSVRMDEEPEPDESRGAGISINVQDHAWGYGTSFPVQLGLKDYDSRCEPCEPVVMTDDEALEWAHDIWRRIERDPGDYHWEVTRREFTDDPSKNKEGPALVDVDAYRIVDGITTSDRSFIVFANLTGDGPELFRATGTVREPVPIAEVGLLTVEEAIEAEKGRVGMDVSAQAENAKLVWDVTFNRENFRSFLIPMYQLPIGSSGEELGLNSTIYAVRRQDLP